MVMAMVMHEQLIINYYSQMCSSIATRLSFTSFDKFLISFVTIQFHLHIKCRRLEIKV